MSPAAATLPAMTEDFRSGWQAAIAAARGLLVALDQPELAARLERSLARPPGDPPAPDAAPAVPSPAVPDVPDEAFTLTLEEAAAAKGVHVSTLRQRVQRGDLEARKIGRRWMLRREAMEEFQRDPRGRQASVEPPGSTLRVRTGEVDGLGLDIRHDGIAEAVSDGASGEVRIAGWTKALVRTYREGAGSERVFILAPGDAEERVGNGPFVVEGKFDVVRKVNNPHDARKVWRAGDEVAGLVRPGGRQ